MIEIPLDNDGICLPAAWKASLFVYGLWALHVYVHPQSIMHSRATLQNTHNLSQDFNNSQEPGKFEVGTWGLSATQLATPWEMAREPERTVSGFITGVDVGVVLPNGHVGIIAIPTGPDLRSANLPTSPHRDYIITPAQAHEPQSLRPSLRNVDRPP
jgi:hypothetical protein